MKETDLSNVDISLFALVRLGGTTKKIHTEHIAWEAYQLAPERFSWRLPEFRDQGFPDKTPVRFALEQAKKKSHGYLVKGRAGGDASGQESEGWILTAKGVEWIKLNESRIKEALKLKKSKLRPREASRFLKKIKKEMAFRRYLQEGNLDNVSIYMITDMLGCSPDAPKGMISEKFERYFNTAQLSGEKAVISFLDECSKKFPFLRG
jgi:hypothetical protein